MLCRSCCREIPDGTKFCPECGAPTEAGANAAMGNDLLDQMAQRGFDPGNFERYTLGGIFGQESGQTGQYQKGQVSSNQGYFNRTLPPAKPKQSGMSTAAMILGILTCTAIIGFIIGLIDLIKNKGDGNKHGGSIFAVVWGGIILLATVSNAVRLGHDRTNTNTASPVVESTQDTSDHSNDGHDQSAASDDSNDGHDQSAASDDSVQRSNDSYSDSQTEDSGSQEQSSSDPGVVDPQLKAALDSYEEFIDEYVKFMKNYTQTSDPMAMLSEYTQYMTKYSEMMQKISELDKMRDQMSAADLAYYIDWTARIEKKMLEISNYN